MSQSQNLSDVEDESHKNDNPLPKQEQRKRRRKRIDEDGRDYTCACGKSYLSYPALYTHVKTKHNQESFIAQKLKIPTVPTDQANVLKEQSNYQKQSKPIKKDTQQDQFGIENLKQFLLRQFIREKSQQNLIEVKNSLKLKEEQASYINHILHLAANIETKFQDENKNIFSNSKSQISAGPYTRQDTNEMINALQSSPEFKKYGQINIIKNIIEKNHKDRNSNIIQKKGFTPCLFPIQQFSRKNISREEVVVDEILGMFLSDFLKIGQSHDITTHAMTFFLCQIRQFFSTHLPDKPTCQLPGESIMQESNDMVCYLTSVQNPYIRQPIVVCKVLFFLMRWMFKHQLTQKLVKFNQAGSS